MHRILVKCVVNYGSDYLLLQKWYDDRIDEPYQWDFPDGEVEFGESPERAAYPSIQVRHPPTRKACR